MGFSALLGLAFGALAIRRQGIYFAMITLALSQMVFFMALQLKFTGGEDGIQAVPRGHLFGVIDLNNSLSMYYFVLAVFLVGFAVVWRAVHSPFGQVLKAIRENEPRAVSLGYRTERYKLLAFVLSASLAGLAGGTKALVFQLASLTDVTWQMSGEVVLMTLLGGMGTLLGPVVGASHRRHAGKLSGGHQHAGSGGDRRDLRGLRAGLPPWYRGRTSGPLRPSLNVKNRTA
uniref:Putative permease ABC transporter protein n=1 Tax=Azospirillum brasilense TaxID=192 RepID=Q8L2F0_AZOBR|nr:putative permease ABC transporter protein [Azospirillum brasilense]